MASTHEESDGEEEQAEQRAGGKEAWQLSCRMQPDEQEIPMDPSLAGMLVTKVGLLEQDIERFSDGLQNLVGEAEGLLGGVFERIAILHGRTARIETMLGLPVFGEEDEEDGAENSSGAFPSGFGPGSPRGFGSRSPKGPSSPSGARATRTQPRTTCRRGHPLRPEEVSEGEPPRVCGFCKQSKPVSHVCSEGCYFSACAECCAVAASAAAGGDCEAAAGDGVAAEEYRDGPLIQEVTEAEAEELRNSKINCSEQDQGDSNNNEEQGGSPDVHGRPRSGSKLCREDSEELTRRLEAAATECQRRDDEEAQQGPYSSQFSRRPSERRHDDPAEAMGRSGRDTPIEDPSIQGSKASCRPTGQPHRSNSGGSVACFREPGTPSTDIPENEVQTALGSPSWAGDDQEDQGLPRRRCGIPPSGMPGAPVKVRLAALEAEMKELEKRLAEGCSSAASPSCPSVPPPEELERVVAQLLADESSCLVQSIRAEAERIATSVTKSISEDGTSGLAEKLRGETNKKIQEVLGDVQKQQVAFSNAFEHALKKDLEDRYGKQLTELRQEMTNVQGAWKANSGIIENANNGFQKLQENLNHLSGKVMALEAVPLPLPTSGRGSSRSGLPTASVARSPSSSGRLAGAPVGVRGLLAGSPSSTQNFGSEGDPSEGLLVGLADAFTVLSRKLGLLGENEQFSESHEGWSTVGKRLDRVWAARVRDYAQPGLEHPPHLFDVLRYLRATGSHGAGGVPPPLPVPDRKDGGAKLATRLAAAVAFGSSVGSEDATTLGSQPHLHRDSSNTISVSGVACLGQDGETTTRNMSRTQQEAWSQQDPFGMSSASMEGMGFYQHTGSSHGRPPTPRRSLHADHPTTPHARPVTPNRGMSSARYSEASPVTSPYRSPGGLRRQSSYGPANMTRAARA